LDEGQEGNARHVTSFNLNQRSSGRVLLLQSQCRQEKTDMNPEEHSISRRTMVTRLGLGITGSAITAAVPVEGQVVNNGTAAPFADPTTKYPKPPYPGQTQPWPGLASKMNPRPDHGETSYKGSGRLSGRKALIPVGAFDGQSDIGAALVPGSGTYDSATKRYTIRSAGYNIWYSRDEFRYIWKKISGDASLAADATFPDPKGYDDRKVVLIIRQNLDDDSHEAMVGEHGSGMIHLAQRPNSGAMMTDMQYRFGGTLEGVLAKRIGIEKHGNSIAIFVSLKGEPMSQLGPPIHLDFHGPFYVGLGFCSHLPIKPDTAVFSNVVLENSAGKVQ
jgi:hypothetical protein